MSKSVKYALPIVFLIVVLSIYYGLNHYPKIQLRTFMIESMNDPTSVLLRNEIINDGYLCGEINAKNRLGAYVGFDRFIANDAGYLIEGSEIVGKDVEGYGTAIFGVRLRSALNQKGISNFESDEFSSAWNVMCNSN